MRRHTFIKSAIGTALLAIGVSGTANAQSLTTFASVDTLGQVFQFLNSSGSSTFGVTPVSIPITFKYKVANGMARSTPMSSER